MGALEGDIVAAGGVILAIYTSYGWEADIEEAAEHIGAAFSGGYWTGRAPPVPMNVLPANAVIDMQTGVILAGTGDIDEPEDFLTHVTAAGGD